MSKFDLELNKQNALSTEQIDEKKIYKNPSEHLKIEIFTLANLK